MKLDIHIPNAAGIMVCCTDKVLWVRRSPSSSSPLTWTNSVGGGLESGETFFEAARREFYEETGYKGKISFNRHPICEQLAPVRYRVFKGVVPKMFSPDYDVQDEIVDHMWRRHDDVPQHLPSQQLHYGARYFLDHCHHKQIWAPHPLEHVLDVDV
jgi:8-oxo-dGTP pyrophosphatase MutT (NUDIX family)